MRPIITLIADPALDKSTQIEKIYPDQKLAFLLAVWGSQKRLRNWWFGYVQIKPQSSLEHTIRSMAAIWQGNSE